MKILKKHLPQFTCARWNNAKGFLNILLVVAIPFFLNRSVHGSNRHDSQCPGSCHSLRKGVVQKLGSFGQSNIRSTRSSLSCTWVPRKKSLEESSAGKPLAVLSHLQPLSWRVPIAVGGLRESQEPFDVRDVGREPDRNAYCTTAWHAEHP